MQHPNAITQFVVEEFLPDLRPGELAADLDLVEAGVIDSLGLLKVIAWLEDRFGICADDVELAPENFRSVEAIDAFVVQATAAQHETA